MGREVERGRVRGGRVGERGEEKRRGGRRWGDVRGERKVNERRRSVMKEIGEQRSLTGQK